MINSANKWEEEDLTHTHYTGLSILDVTCTCYTGLSILEVTHTHTILVCKLYTIYDVTISVVYLEQKAQRG